MISNKFTIDLPQELKSLQFDRDHFVPDANIAEVTKANCEMAVHLFYRKVFDLVLPHNARTAELLGGHEDFEERNDLSEVQVGDILLFGSRKRFAEVQEYIPQYDEVGTLTNYIRSHMAVAVTTDPYLFHCNKYGSAVWSVEEFVKRRQYEVILKILYYKGATHIHLF